MGPESAGMGVLVAGSSRCLGCSSEAKMSSRLDWEARQNLECRLSPPAEMQ